MCVFLFFLIKETALIMVPVGHTHVHFVQQMPDAIFCAGDCLYLRQQVRYLIVSVTSSVVLGPG